MNTKSISVLLSLACAGVACAASNYDLLGRNGSKMNSPMVYRNVDYAKAQKSSLDENKAALAKKEVITYFPEIDSRCVAKKPFYFSGSFQTDTRKYGFDLVINEDEKDDYSKNNFYRIQHVVGDEEAFYEVALNCGEKEAVKYVEKNFSHYGYKDVQETNTGRDVSFSATPVGNVKNPYEYNATLDYFRLEPNRVVRYANSVIGVYYENDAQPARMGGIWHQGYHEKYNIYKNYSSVFSIQQEVESSRMFNALNEVANSKVIYSYDFEANNKAYPPAPDNRYPQILVGLHTRNSTQDNSSEIQNYNDLSCKLDDYIYDNQTVEVVGAGNFGTKPDGSYANRYLAADAHAVNAITVGSLALDLSTGLAKVEKSSSRQVSSTSVNKPEMVNFTNYFFNAKDKNYTVRGKVYSYPTMIDGTQGAAALTAGQVTNLLSEYPFYRWHPEVVKALLLTSSRMVPTNGYVQKKVGYPNDYTIMGHTSRDYSVDPVNVTHQSQFFSGRIDKSTVFTDRGAYREYVKTIDTKANHEYRAAIAWLSRCSDIIGVGANGHIPQNFDLVVYRNDACMKSGTKATMCRFDASTSTLVSTSSSLYNPYEVVSFNSKEAGVYSFVIRYKSDATSDKNVKLGFDIMENRLFDSI